MAVGDRYKIGVTFVVAGRCSTLTDRMREVVICTDDIPAKSAAISYVAEFSIRWTLLASTAAKIVSMYGQRVHPTPGVRFQQVFTLPGSVMSPPLPGQAPLLLTRWTEGAPALGRSTLYVPGLAQTMAYGGRLTDTALPLAQDLADMFLENLHPPVVGDGVFLCSHTYHGNEAEFADYITSWPAPQLGTSDRRIADRCSPNA